MLLLMDVHIIVQLMRIVSLVDKLCDALQTQPSFSRLKFQSEHFNSELLSFEGTLA